ncbi:MAG: arsenic efflux protein [Clostridia bacterium]|nr:arsenic efflux protein [Clostridia bacterium]
MIEHFPELLLHALQDTAPLLFWILLMYFAVELLESNADLSRVNRLGGKLGPLVGSATGLVPQCGFSVMAAKFYEQKYITLGTLLAIFMATSDEAFIIMLSSGEGAVWLLPTLAVKILVGVAVGYGADFLMKLLGRKQVCVEIPTTENNEPTSVKEYFIQQYIAEKDVDVKCSCGRSHAGDSVWKKYVLYPLWHTLKVGGFIFLVNFVLTAIIHSVGEETFSAFMLKNRFVQPLITCLIGLIPNCASSVVITETFLGGGITFGACVAGLCVNAGMGFVVLLKNMRQWKRNLLLISACYAVSVSVGMILNIFPLMA